MTKITELVEKYKNGEMNFESLLEEVPEMEWGAHHEEVDDETVGDGKNKISDAYGMWNEGILSEEERQKILGHIQ